MAQRPQFATPDAQSLCHLKAEPVWPETALGSAARVQPLSAGPTLVDREMTTEAQVWAFAGTISYSTWKSSSLPPREERDFGLEAASGKDGSCHIPCRVPRRLQRLSSFPGPAQACGGAALR